MLKLRNSFHSVRSVLSYDSKILSFSLAQGQRGGKIRLRRLNCTNQSNGDGSTCLENQLLKKFF